MERVGGADDEYASATVCTVGCGRLRNRTNRRSRINLSPLRQCDGRDNEKERTVAPA